MTDLSGRSTRTLAWLGDVEFEREVRYRLARRGDYPTDRLDTMKTRIVRAEAQAELLESVLPLLEPDELAVVQRGRNAATTASARGARRKTEAYRGATALEALVAVWCFDEPKGRQRFEEVLGARLEAAVDAALAADARRPKRG